MRGVGDPRPSPGEIVRRGYDAIGDRYHAWSHQGETRLRFVHQVLERLPLASSVVDLGCGPGDPATRLLSERHTVLGVDVSAGQLAIARRLAPAASFVQADVCAFALRSALVDAVVSFYVTGHIPSAEHGRLYNAIAGWLRPGGLLLTSAPLMAGDDIEDAWLGVPMFFGGIGADATVSAVADAGLVVERAETVEEHLDDGSNERFLWVTASKPAKPLR